jgi:hypothetical protein
MFDSVWSRVTYIFFGGNPGVGGGNPGVGVDIRTFEVPGTLDNGSVLI